MLASIALLIAGELYMEERIMTEMGNYPDDRDNIKAALKQIMSTCEEATAHRKPLVLNGDVRCSTRPSSKIPHNSVRGSKPF